METSLSCFPKGSGSKRIAKSTRVRWFRTSVLSARPYMFANKADVQSLGHTGCQEAKGGVFPEDIQVSDACHFLVDYG